MNRQTNPSISAFNRDVTGHRGYLYSTDAHLSSRLANQRLTEVGLSMIDYRGKKVIDIGCGDGMYTVELYDLGKPKSILGIDPAAEPIKIAKEKIDKRNIEFSVHAAAPLPFADDRFDIAYVRGVLHHMDNPDDAIHEALRVARHLVVIEPNGYNPGLKVIERLSQYHRQHGEKSYPPHRLCRCVWRNGGRIIKYKYAGFVPMFCPDWLANILKRLEPAIETLPLIKNLWCAVFVFLADKK